MAESSIDDASRDSLTVQVLMKELGKVTKWYEFGIALKIPVEDMESIENSNQTAGIGRCKIAMLNWWLTITPTASWNDIIRALKDIGYHALANKLTSKYIQQPQLSAVALPSPPDDPRVLLKLLKLQTCYGQMVSTMLHLSSKVDLGHVKTFLEATIGDRDFRECRSFEGVLYLLIDKHIDIFNITRLEQLSNKINHNAMKQLVASYNKEKEKFLHEVTVVDFHHEVASKVNYQVPIGERAEVVIRIPHEYANPHGRTLKDMETLASKAFGDYYPSFIRMTVKPGSFLVVWQFPVSLSPKLDHAAQESSDLFAEEGVELVMVAGRVVYTSDRKFTMVAHRHEHKKQQLIRIHKVEKKFQEEQKEQIERKLKQKEEELAEQKHKVRSLTETNVRYTTSILFLFVIIIVVGFFTWKIYSDLNDALHERDSLVDKLGTLKQQTANCGPEELQELKESREELIQYSEAKGILNLTKKELAHQRSVARDYSHKYMKLIERHDIQSKLDAQERDECKKKIQTCESEVAKLNQDHQDRFRAYKEDLSRSETLLSSANEKNNKCEANGRLLIKQSTVFEQEKKVCVEERRIDKKKLIACQQRAQSLQQEKEECAQMRAKCDTKLLTSSDCKKTMLELVSRDNKMCNKELQQCNDKLVAKRDELEESYFRRRSCCWC